MKIINITDNDISELNVVLNSLNKNNLYLYHLLKEKKDDNLLISMDESLIQILEHYKKQISRMYMLNIIEQNLVNNKDTQLNQVINSLKIKLSNKEIMDSYIINGLCLSNIQTIFNDNSYEYTIKCSNETIKRINEDEYLRIGFEYSSTFGDTKKIKKKIPNCVQ